MMTQDYPTEILLEVKSTGEKIPLLGVLQNLSINGEILIDSNNSAGSNKPQKTMRGYKDKSVSLTLRLVSMKNKTVYDLLKELENIFQDEEDDTPTVYKIFNKHTEARDIDEVLLTNLSSSEDNTSNTITVALSFEEFISARYQDASN